MTENIAVPTKTRKLNSRILLAALSILLLLLVYGVGFIVLPIFTLTGLQKGNCESVISWHQVYTSLYPKPVQDQTLTAPVKECEVYIAAVSAEETGAWREAYDAYQVYVTTYPNGLYAKNVHEHSALTLMNVVKGQVEQKQYEEALPNLKLILSSYADTSSAADAWPLIPQVYASWGSAYRDAEDFGRAEQIFNDFKAWSQTNQKAESEAEARRELAKTYLAWGLALQTHQQYDTALAKFDLAVAADPQSQFDSAAEVRSGQRNVYVEWGNVFLGLGEFPTAIEKFEKAASLSDGESDDGAWDALSNGRIQWAASLSAAEDFNAALDQLKLAKDAAQTDTARKSIEIAFSDTYLAFSKSTGIQARVAMREAVERMCKQKKAPELPIFGLNRDSVQMGVYGDDAKLPAEFSAKTPGEMHYVVCVKVGNKTVDSRQQKNIFYIPSKGYFYTIIQQFRVQLSWDLEMLEITTGKKVAKTTLSGGMPPPFPQGSEGTYFAGPPPTDEQVTTWLQSSIK